MGHRNRNDRTRHVRRSSGGVLIAALALVFFVSASHLSAQQVTSQSRVRVESDDSPTRGWCLCARGQGHG